MNCRFARFMAAGLVLAASLPVATSAEPRHMNANVEILVNGVPQAQYAQNGRWYVEALKGKEYAIRLHNPYQVRVAVALSVDGLNTIDAQQTTANGARKWVLGAYQTATISGWQTSQTEARRFEFTTEAALLRPGARQDREPRGDFSRVLQGARGREPPRHERVRGPSGARRSRARPFRSQRRRANRRRPPKGAVWMTNTRPPEWAVAPITPSRACGWISKRRPLRP